MAAIGTKSTSGPPSWAAAGVSVLIGDGEEMGGGVFPLNPDEPDIEEAISDAYDEALDEGQAWLASRPTSEESAPQQAGAFFDVSLDFHIKGSHTCTVF